MRPFDSKLVSAGDRGYGERFTTVQGEWFFWLAVSVFNFVLSVVGVSLSWFLVCLCGSSTSLRFRVSNLFFEPSVVLSIYIGEGFHVG